MVNNGYSSPQIGSISFMNVIIDEDKNIIAIYPIFLFYLFIAWFVIFI
jgi:protein YIPF6